MNYCYPGSGYLRLRVEDFDSRGVLRRRVEALWPFLCVWGEPWGDGNRFGLDDGRLMAVVLGPWLVPGPFEPQDIRYA